jgi:uncharacterized metal-binding protein
MYTCASCNIHACQTGDLSKTPKNCPCLETEDKELTKRHYKEEQNYKIAHNSAAVEAEGYCRKTRLEETMDFARKCGFTTLGIAFCIGLKSEAKKLTTILRDNGFIVNSVVCKNQSIPKEFIGIGEDEKVRPGTYEPMCNPIGQAVLLNKSKTDLNIILGLCVGHDSLFIKYSEAPVTVFATKDRVLCHNPMAVLYLADGYYKDKLRGSR